MTNWSELRFHKAVPERRGYHASFVHNGTLYIHGGYDIKDGSLSSLWALNMDKYYSLKDVINNYNMRGSASSLYGPESLCADQI
jgi:hypothetical protein